MTSFDVFGLPEALERALSRLGFGSPTPIQAETIPLALAGKDILGSAQTGTGKTAAFLLPVLAKLWQDKQKKALVLTPTRELATQVMAFAKQLVGQDRTVGTALLIGGEPMPKQFQQLDRKPRLIIGTPGRVQDHLNRRSLNLRDATFLVLDETDRMLDMGFGIQIEEIVPHLAPKRQTLMFSATLPAEIERMADKYLIDPARVAIGQTNAPAAKVKQEIVHTSEADKFDHLLTHISKCTGSMIVFVKTKLDAERIAKRLIAMNLGARAMHGDLQQHKRDRVLHGFRTAKYPILVATDIAARGLDVPDIKLVVNFNVPHHAEDYIHRIGRTARAGAEGSSVCFVSPDDARRWKAIQRLLNPGAVSNDRDPKKPFRNGNGSRHKRSGSSGSGRPAFGGSGSKDRFNEGFKRKKRYGNSSTARKSPA